MVGNKSIFLIRFSTLMIFCLLFLVSQNIYAKTDEEPLLKKKYAPGKPLIILEKIPEDLMEMLIDTSVQDIRILGEIIDEYDSLRNDIRVEEKTNVQLTDVFNILGLQEIKLPIPVYFDVKLLFKAKRTMKYYANRFYQNPEFWTKIYWENKDLFSNIQLNTKEVILTIKDVEVNHPDMQIITEHTDDYRRSQLFLSSFPIMECRVYPKREFSRIWHDGIVLSSSKTALEVIAKEIQGFLKNYKQGDSLVVKNENETNYVYYYNNKEIFSIDASLLSIPSEELAVKIGSFSNNLRRYIGLAEQEVVVEK